MSYILVTDHAGVEHRLDAVEGWRVMEILREHGLPVAGTCDGMCACASCHVYVDQNWQPRLHPPRDDELEALDETISVEDNSRLSCQVLFSPELAGLKLTLAPG